MSEAPASRAPITLTEFARGVRDDFFQWDRGLVGTFLNLLWRPAHVCRAFIYERDDRYTPPWRYLLFGVVVSVAASWLALDVLGQRTRAGAQTAAILDNAALLTLLTLPLVAIAMRLWFIGLKVRYLDALIVLFYTQGQVNILALSALGALALTGSPVAQAPISIAILVYLVWAWASFGAGPWWRRLPAAILTLISGQLINAGIVYGALHLLR